MVMPIAWSCLIASLIGGEFSAGAGPRIAEDPALVIMLAGISSDAATVAGLTPADMITLRERAEDPALPAAQLLAAMAAREAAVEALDQARAQVFESEYQVELRRAQARAAENAVRHAQSSLDMARLQCFEHLVETLDSAKQTRLQLVRASLRWDLQAECRVLNFSQAELRRIEAHSRRPARERRFASNSLFEPIASAPSPQTRPDHTAIVHPDALAARQRLRSNREPILPYFVPSPLDQAASISDE